MYILEGFRFAAVKNFCKDLDPSFQIEKYCTARRGPLMTLKKTASKGVKYNNTWCKEETSLKLIKTL